MEEGPQHHGPDVGVVTEELPGALGHHDGRHHPEHHQGVGQPDDHQDLGGRTGQQSGPVGVWVLTPNVLHGLPVWASGFSKVL